MKKVIAAIIICVLLCGVAMAKAPTKEEIAIGKSIELILSESKADVEYNEEKNLIVLRQNIDTVKSEFWGSKLFVSANQELIDAISKSSESFYDSCAETFGNLLPDFIMLYYSSDGELIMAYCNGVEIGDLIGLY